MATPKKLDTFILRDRFSSSPETLQEEAQASAIRRSEVMEWVEVSVKPSEVAVFTDGEFQCHSFEIWGFEAESAETERQSEEASQVKSQKDKAAAKDASL